MYRPPFQPQNIVTKLHLLKKYRGQERQRVFQHLGAGPSYNDAVNELCANFTAHSSDIVENAQNGPENLTSGSGPGIWQLVGGCLSRAWAIIKCCSCCHTGNQEPIQDPEKFSVQETGQISVLPWCPGNY